MAIYTKSNSGPVRHGIRVIKTGSGVHRIASLWVKTARGLVLIYQSVRSCFGSGRWVSRKPWVNNEKWKNHK